ncbi:MAG TPA: DUF2284 domain-containing protein [Bacillota bacterium]|nr:DUF2284 domain-containing protein [Bacillota bacterium]
MYQTEEFTSRTTVEDYLSNYANGERFLEYCEKFTGCGHIWSCPLYDFDPAEYEKKYKYFYIIGKRITFDQPDEGKGKSYMTRKEREQREKDRHEREKYMNQVCLREKDILSETIYELEKKYPGSIGLPAGSCRMCRQCSKPQEKGCRYSEEIRYFLESLGADVNGTAGDLLGMELRWMKDRMPKDFTLINGFLTDSAKVEI